jgi:hypothetical protein
VSTEKIESWRDLLVWQKAHAAALEVYRQFLVIARGSIEETRYLLLLAKDLGFLPSESHASLESLYTEISKMTNALLRSLKS